ncbi:alpha-amylase family glycosyl hydrolase [Spirochaeta cellobiosiphila]|uniref:alpha-amylase family glycosyl hydrolase n=1 Tax=Spirochaeta cellobiosiphila TaxID=504483 RepID=UPI00041ED948|nr:alpha-amylase family glycosyl hydrolase [Spirochaeta cellobiosiphila]
MSNRIIQLWKSLYNDNTTQLCHNIIGYCKNKTTNNGRINIKGTVLKSNPYELGGNFRTIREKIPFLKELNIGSLWLTSVFSTPCRQKGFDISSLDEIEFELGSEKGLELLIESLHNDNISLILDVVISRTSIEHPWFIDARTSPKSKNRNKYIWTNTTEGLKPVKHNHWPSPDKTWFYNSSTDDYYLSSRGEDMPDLNWKNPEVAHDIILSLLKLTELPIDGIHLPWIQDIWHHKKVLKLIKYCFEEIGADLPIICHQNIPHKTTKSILKPFAYESKIAPEEWVKLISKNITQDWKRHKNLSFNLLQDYFHNHCQMVENKKYLWDIVDGDHQKLLLIQALNASLTGFHTILGPNSVGATETIGTYDEEYIRKTRFDKFFPPHKYYNQLIELNKQCVEFKDFLQLKPKVKSKGTLLIIQRRHKKERLWQIFNLSSKKIDYKDKSIEAYSYLWYLE